MPEIVKIFVLREFSGAPVKKDTLYKVHLRIKKSCPLISMGRYRTMYAVGINKSNPMFDFVAYFYEADKG